MFKKYYLLDKRLKEFFVKLLLKCFGAPIGLESYTLLNFFMLSAKAVFVVVIVFLLIN